MTEALLPPEAFELPKGALDAARDVLVRQESVRVIGAGDHPGWPTFVRLRRVKDEAENLLADLHQISQWEKSGIPRDHYLVPHQTLFFTFVNDHVTDKFFFPFLDDGVETEDAKRLEIWYQIGELFKIWIGTAGYGSHRKNILFEATVEDLNEFIEQLTNRDIQFGLNLKSILTGTAHLKLEKNELSGLVTEIAQVASGIWRSDILTHFRLKENIRKLLGVIDVEIVEKLDGLIDDAWRHSQARQKLLDVFRKGAFYQLNSCPGLPDNVRQMYRRIAQDRHFNESYMILASQLRGLIDFMETKSVERGTLEKSIPQQYRDARLLSSIHIANTILHANDVEKHGRQIHLVTNADKMTNLVRAFRSGEFRAPIRHPRFLSALLRSDRPEEVTTSLAIVASSLGEMIKHAEDTGKVRYETLEEVTNSLKESWRSIVENMVIFLESYSSGFSGKTGPRQRMKKIRQMTSRSSRQGPARELGLDVSALGAHVLHFATIEVTSHLIALGNTDHRVFVELIGGATPAVVAVPISRHLRFAVRLRNPAIVSRIGERLGNQPIGQLDYKTIKEAIDTPRGTSTGLAASFFESIANRLALGLDAMTLRNWGLAHVICSFAVEQFDSNPHRHEQDEALPLLTEILFVRQLSLQALAAQSLQNTALVDRHLNDAKRDIERMKEDGANDLRVMLAEVAFSTERLIFSAITRQAGGESAPIDRSWSLEEIGNRLVELERGIGKEWLLDSEGTLNRQYFTLRIFQYLLMVYAIVWSGLIKDVITSTEVDRFQGIVDWRDWFYRFREAFDRFSKLVMQYFGDAEIEFPLVKFLILFGELVIENKYRAHLASANSQTATRALAAFMNDLDQMQQHCNAVSDRGLAKRVMRAVNARIASEFREPSVMLIQSRFDSIAPEE